jgi:hypothetical protein
VDAFINCIVSGLSQASGMLPCYFHFFFFFLVMVVGPVSALWFEFLEKPSLLCPLSTPRSYLPSFPASPVSSRQLRPTPSSYSSYDLCLHY